MFKSTDIAENCLSIQLNGQSLEIMEKFCYLVDTIGTGVGEVIRSGWGNFRDLLPFQVGRGLP